MPDSRDAVWASRVRSTIRVSARPSRPPWATPISVAHTQAPATGAVSRPVTPAAIRTTTPTAGSRWSRMRPATSGTKNEPTICTSV